MRPRCYISIQRVIVVLALLVIILQVFHIYLMMQQEDSPADIKGKTSSTSGKLMLQEIKNAYMLDSSGYYFIVPNILQGGGGGGGGKGFHSSVSPDIALATHTTSNNLQHLLQLSRRWQGLLSVSVLTHSHDAEYALQSILRLYECNKDIQQNVMFHLVFPVSSHKYISNIVHRDVNCENEQTMNTRDYENFEIGELQYPHNILRNLAMKMVTASFILVSDIDLLPSVNLSKSFQMDMINSKIVRNKNAYILPVFETGENKYIPSTKEELLTDKNVRPFYGNVCAKCQQFTNYKRWKNARKSDKLEVAFSVEWQHPYEPFFIASKSSLPLYDERFKQYGYNRVSQVRSIHVKTVAVFLERFILIIDGSRWGLQGLQPLCPLLWI